MSKIDYTRGAATFTQDSNIVRGQRTFWLAAVNPGDWIHIDDSLVVDTAVPAGEEVTFADPNVNGTWYQIVHVTSDTQLEIDRNFPYETHELAPYLIRRNPDRYLTAELARTQLLLLDKQIELEDRFDGFDEKIDIATNKAQQSEYFAGRSEAAQQASELAQSLSEQARDASQAAQQLSEQARDASQAAQQASEDARDASLAAQAAAELAQQQSEFYANKSEGHSISAAETVSYFQSILGEPNGIVPLDEDALIPPKFIPASFQDVIPVEHEADLENITGDFRKLYLALDTNKTFMWSETSQRFVNTDTTLALAGTGTAPSAAHSDHNHDGIYEPYSRVVVASLDDINLNSEGMYYITGTSNVTIGRKSYAVKQVNIRKFGTGYYYIVATAFNEKNKAFQLINNLGNWELLSGGGGGGGSGEIIVIDVRVSPEFLDANNIVDDGEYYIHSGTAWVNYPPKPTFEYIGFNTVLNAWRITVQHNDAGMCYQYCRVQGHLSTSYSVWQRSGVSNWTDWTRINYDVESSGSESITLNVGETGASYRAFIRDENALQALYLRKVFHQYYGAMVGYSELQLFPEEARLAVKALPRPAGTTTTETALSVAPGSISITNANLTIDGTINGIKHQFVDSYNPADFEETDLVFVDDEYESEVAGVTSINGVKPNGAGSITLNVIKHPSGAMLYINDSGNLVFRNKNGQEAVVIYGE